MARLNTFCLLLAFVLQYVRAFSPYTVKDYTLNSQSHFEVFTAGWLECLLACSQDSLCSSYNYHYEKEANGLCELYECGLDDCFAAGKSLVFTRGHLFQQIKPSLNRPKCLKDVDECSSNPCLNGGTCTNQVNGFSCACNMWYNGTRCEQNISECASNPCHNGGTCKNQVNGYSCDCKNGYSGSKCEVKHSGTCNSFSCKNGGTCHTRDGLFWCVCVPFYSGYECETPRLHSNND